MHLVWFKRDLRVQDHAGLAAVPAGAPMIAIYVVEPDYWALPDTSGRQWAFVRDSLAGLECDLSQLGVSLVVRVGDVIDVFEHLRVRYGVTDVVAHEETGNAWTFARDRRVSHWARGQGVRFVEFAGSGVVRRLGSRDGWARAMPDGPHDTCPGQQRGGRGEAISLLNSFLGERGRDYRRAMSSPLDAEWACSRLSPHIAVGTISVRDVVRAAAVRQNETTDATWRKSLKSFQSRLAWRDHFIQKIEDQPSLETRCLHSAYEGMRGDECEAFARPAG